MGTARRCATTTPTRGSRPSSPATAGSPSTRLRAEGRSQGTTAPRRQASTRAMQADAFDRATGARATGGASQLERFLQKERLEEQQRAGRSGRGRRPAGRTAGVAAGGFCRRRCYWSCEGHPPPASVSDARSEAARRCGPAQSSPTSSSTRGSRFARARHPLTCTSSCEGSSVQTVSGSPLRSPRHASGRRSGDSEAAAQAHRELRALLRVIRHGLSRTARLRGFVTLRSLRA